MNSAGINLHGYFNNYVFLHNFIWPDVDEFWAWLAKILSFFYNTSIDKSAHVKVILITFN